MNYDLYRCPVCYWEAKIPCPDHSMKKDKRYFIEIVIKDSDSLESVRSVSTSSDYPESLFSPPVDHRIASEVNGCLGILFSMPLNKNENIPCRS